MTLVTDYLDASATRFPDKTAIVDAGGETTFKELRDEALHIASYIIRHFGCFKSPVCFYLDKSAMCIAVMMGVAYSGNFYTPIDTKMPAARIEKILQTLEHPLVITDRSHLAKVQAFAPELNVFCVEEALTEPYDEQVIRQVTDTIIDTDVLYVLFTSGSTGNPKGVIIGQRSVMDYIDWVTRTFHFSPDTVFGNQAPFYFDNSVLDIYAMLKNGATMVIIPTLYFAFPIRLLDFMQKKQINTVFWVPAALCLVANLKALSLCHVDTLKTILFAGEIMPNKQLNQWRQEYPHALYANLYGPTEITVDCTAYIVDRSFRDDEPLPIGTPARNADVFLLDDQSQRITAPGETGEICVRGTSLAYGYYNNPEKTREAFVQNPLQQAYEEKIYRTGDLAEYNERGELVYLSRKDFQIKHMGRRIELGEIETVVSSLDGITQNCCLYDGVRRKIVLFYAGILSEEELLAGLKTRLPDYMMPGRVVHKKRLPINLNGKIDRTLLKQEL